ncbi:MULTISPECIES: TIGR03013 family XrtA/PEP-CTERM system glycosyltransferase [unclassified Luteimonas]
MGATAESRKVRAFRTLWLAEMLALVAAVAVAAELPGLFTAAAVEAELPEITRFMGPATSFGEATIRILPVLLFVTGAMAAFGLYQVHARHGRGDFVFRLLLSFAAAAIGLFVLHQLVAATWIEPGILAIALLLGLWAVVGLRVITRRYFGSTAFKRRVLVYGAGRNADLINSRLRRDSDRQSFVVVGFVPVPGQVTAVAPELLIEAPDGILELASALRVDEVVVAPDERRGGLPMPQLLGCAQSGVVVLDLSTLFEREAGVVNANVADPSWLVFSGGFDHTAARRLTKRIFDVTAAVALLLAAWPAMLLVALAIRLESGSPVLYRQTRVGENGHCFELVKFRSMRLDAEGDGVARWASKDDDRSTRLGRFIRTTRLDELPQLFNVLRGDMSFVGPRPERPQFVDMLAEQIRYYGVRHCVKPGLTGWAQLRYPYGASVRDAEEKLTFDLYYVKNQRLVFDLMILLQTVEVVLFRKGAR